MSGRFDVAVFPLLNAVLFPGVTLPLHIFERRYWQMLQDVQSRGWELAISLAIPQNEQEFRLSSICGAGSVQVCRENPERRTADILVHGESRVRLLGFVQREPYFVMEAERLARDAAGPPPEGERPYGELLSLVKAWAFLNPDLSDRAPLIFDAFRGPGELCDFFAFHFIRRASDKQVYLSCTNPYERAEMLARYLETDLARLSRKVTRGRRTARFH
jgi:Lon protease-like protein